MTIRLRGARRGCGGRDIRRHGLIVTAGPGGRRREGMPLGSLDQMKAIILAGGMGTRLSEETDVRPKPMVEIGGMPIRVAHHEGAVGTHGVTEFVVCLGYKGDVIKEWFAVVLPAA